MWSYPDCSSSRVARAVMRLSLATMTLPDLSVMSKRATSPRAGARDKLHLRAAVHQGGKLSLTKKFARMDWAFRPMAFQQNGDRHSCGDGRRGSTGCPLGRTRSPAREPR